MSREETGRKKWVGINKLILCGLSARFTSADSNHSDPQVSLDYYYNDGHQDTKPTQ